MSDGALFLALIKGYIGSGWFFFLCHLALAMWLTVRLVQVRKAAATGGEPPISEDAARSLVGFFILIGVAGTFFGFFSFAVKAKLAGGDVGAIKDALLTASSQAFPVGLFGIVLTLMFHVGTDRAYRGFERRAPGVGVVNSALTARELRELLIEAGVVPAAAGGESPIWASVQEIRGWVSAIGIAATGDSKSNPAKEELRREWAALRASMEGLQRAVEERSAETARYTAGLARAAGTLETVSKNASEAIVAKLDEVSKTLEGGAGLKGLLQEATAAAAATRDAAETSRRTIGETAAEIEGLQKDLRELVSGLERLSKTLSEEGRKTLESLATSAQNVETAAGRMSTEILQAFRERLDLVMTDAKKLVDLTTENVQAIREGLDHATNAYRDAATAGFAALTKGIGDELRPRTKDVADALKDLGSRVNEASDKSTDAARRIADAEEGFARAVGTLGGHVETVGSQTSTLAASVGSVGGTLDSLSQRLNGNTVIRVTSPGLEESALKVLSRVGEVHGESKRLRELAEKNGKRGFFGRLFG